MVAAHYSKGDAEKISAALWMRYTSDMTQGAVPYLVDEMCKDPDIVPGWEAHWKKETSAALRATVPFAFMTPCMKLFHDRVRVAATTEMTRLASDGIAFHIAELKALALDILCYIVHTLPKSMVRAFGMKLRTSDFPDTSFEDAVGHAVTCVAPDSFVSIMSRVEELIQSHP